MNPQQILDLDHRRVERIERQIRIVVQRVQHRPQAFRALHVPIARPVVEHVKVGIEDDRHAQATLAFAAFRAIRASPQAARAAITGSRLRPSVERLYSTFGGTWA